MEGVPEQKNDEVGNSLHLQRLAPADFVVREAGRRNAVEGELVLGDFRADWLGIPATHSHAVDSSFGVVVAVVEEHGDNA